MNLIPGFSVDCFDGEKIGRRIRLFYLLVPLVLLFTHCQRSRPTPEPPPAETDSPATADRAHPIQENRSRVVARILSIEPVDETQYRMMLQIEAVDTVDGLASFARVGDTITVWPNYQHGEGEGVDYEMEPNWSLLQGKTLPPGSRVEAVLYLQSARPSPRWLMLRLKPL